MPVSLTRDCGGYSSVTKAEIEKEEKTLSKELWKEAQAPPMPICFNLMLTTTSLSSRS